MTAGGTTKAMSLRGRTTARERFDKLATTRQRFIEEAALCASFTVPSLFQSDPYSTALPPTPAQGLGARGVNNIASKIMVSMFPGNTSMFRLKVEPEVLADMQAQDATISSKVEKGLADYEARTTSEFSTRGLQHAAYEMARHLIVTGNGMFYVPDDGPIRFYSLHDYTVARDASGNVSEMVVRERIAKAYLPERTQAALPAGSPGTQHPDPHIDLYTSIKLNPDGKRWAVYQEVGGVVIEGTSGEYLRDACPWIPARFIKRRGWDYGGSYVSEYLGDLAAFDGLSQAILDGSAAMARLIYLVNPNGSTTTSDLVRTPNGGFAVGRREDITTLTADKYGDFRVAMEQAKTIEDRLSYAFLLNSAVQRGGERVTAEEIRYVARELEDNLGGIYSLLAAELQMPLVKRMVAVLEHKKALPKLPESVKPMIVTGAEALGRGNDLAKLETATAKAAQVNPEAFMQRLNSGEYFRRVFTAVGVNTSGLLKTDEEVAAEQQQMQAQAMLQQALPQAVNAGGQILKEGMKQ